MRNFHAGNSHNESQVNFVVDDCDNYSCPDDFYAAAIHFLWKSAESPLEPEEYIGIADKTVQTESSVRKEIAECLKATPIANFAPVLEDISDTYSYQNDWNLREFVWSSNGHYWLMTWETLA